MTTGKFKVDPGSTTDVLIDTDLTLNANTGDVAYVELIGKDGTGTVYEVKVNSDGTLAVAGAVSVSGSVEITNDIGNPLPISGTVGVSGNVEVVNDIGNPLPVSGTVGISGTVPVSGTVGVSGNVEITNDVGNPLPVNGTVTITDGSGPVTVDGTVAISNAVALDATLTGGTAKTQLTDGTNSANILKSDGTAAGQNAEIIAAGYQSQAFTFSSVTAGTTYDLGNYRWVSVQVLTLYTGASTPTITFQTSNDGSTWVSQALQATTNSGNAASQTAVAAVSTTSAGIFHGAVQGRYFRLNQTGTYTSGTTTGQMIFSTQPAAFPTIGTVSTLISTNTAGTITTNASTVSSASLSGGGGFVEISIHGTYAGISFGVTSSDDAAVTFYNCPIYDTLASKWLAPGTTISPPDNTSRTYWVPCYPSTNLVKVTASAYTSGTGNIRIVQGSSSANPGSIMAHLFDGAGNARAANVNSSNQLSVSLDNTATVKDVRSTTPAQTSVSVTNSSTSVLASNANRLGFTIWNEGTAICYLKLGATASTTSYSVQIASGGYYECPFNYTGAVDAITSASTSSLRITELT